MIVQYPPMSGYLGFPNWMPTEDSPFRQKRWPSLLERANYVKGSLRAVRITYRTGVKAVKGWIVESDYAYIIETNEGEKLIEFPAGTLLCRIYGIAGAENIIVDG